MQDKWTLGLCAECDQELDTSVRPSLYCGTRCRGIAKDVRYFRRAYRDGRSQDPEVRQALKKRFAIHLAGGYDARGRALPQGVREEVLAANGGLCMACNAERAMEVDHIDGSSSDRSNLQGLCLSCHDVKTFAPMKGLSEEDKQERMRFFATVFAPVPLRACHDETSWEHDERRLRAQWSARVKEIRLGMPTEVVPLSPEEEAEILRALREEHGHEPAETRDS